MVSSNRNNHLFGEAIFFSYIFTNFRMSSLNFMVQGLTYIMKKSCFFCQRYICPKLASKYRRKFCHFNRMLKYILAIACSILESPHQLNYFWIKACYAHFVAGILSSFSNILSQFFFCFFNHSFNTSRLNPPVNNQFFQGSFGKLASYWAEGGNKNNTRGIINNNFASCSLLNNFNISTFSTNNSTFHFVRR